MAAFSRWVSRFRRPPIAAGRFAARPSAATLMAYAALAVLLVTGVGTLLFTGVANRTVYALIGDFKAQRRQALWSAVQINGRSSAITALDYGTWDEMYDFIFEPDPAWVPSTLGWIVEELGYASVLVLDGDGATVHEQGQSLDWPAAIRESVSHYFTSTLATQRQVSTLVYMPQGPSLYWLSGVQIVPSDGPDEAAGHAGYLIIGDLFDADDLAQIESVTGVRHLHLCGDGASPSEPLDAGADEDAASAMLRDALPLQSYIGPPGAVLHYENVLPLAGEQMATWRFASGMSAAAVVVAITACLIAAYFAFVKPFLRLSGAVSALAATGEWAEPPAPYREFHVVADAIGRAIDSRRRAEDALRQAHAGLELQVEVRTAELATANRALAESEQRYRGIVEDLPVLLCRFSSDRRITFANKAYADYFGRAASDIIGMDFLELVPPSDRHVILEMLATIGPDRPMATYEHRVVAGDGSTRWQRWTDRAIFDAAGQVTGFQSIGQDVTEQRELEERLRQSQKMETVGRLAGGIAHDFNNILTAIMAHATFALEGSLTEQATRADIREVMRSADRAKNLTRQLLAFSRRQILEPKPLDLSDLIGDMDHMLRRLIGEDIELVTLPSDRPCTATADPSQMEQVLVNLVVNARDAMPAGGRLTIETGCVTLDADSLSRDADVQPGRFAMLAVSDTGVGMTEEVKAHLFEPFFTTKEVGKGTGLGLATVYGIAKQHGGTVWADGEPGQGSTFKVFLPAVEQEPCPGGRQTGSGPAAAGKETILLAEDEAVVRAVAARMLQRLGYTVLRAPDGEAALELAERYLGPIDLLITDVVMPRMGGPELAQRLRRQRPSLRVLYISGYTDRDLHQDDAEGHAEFLHKPFSEEMLARKVRVALEAPAAPP